MCFFIKKKISHKLFEVGDFVMYQEREARIVEKLEHNRLKLRFVKEGHMKKGDLTEDDYYYEIHTQEELEEDTRKALKDIVDRM